MNLRAGWDSPPPRAPTSERITRRRQTRPRGRRRRSRKARAPESDRRDGIISRADARNPRTQRRPVSDTEAVPENNRPFGGGRHDDLPNPPPTAHCLRPVGVRPARIPGHSATPRPQARDARDVVSCQGAPARLKKFVVKTSERAKKAALAEVRRAGRPDPGRGQPAWIVGPGDEPTRASCAWVVPILVPRVAKGALNRRALARGRSHQGDIVQAGRRRVPGRAGSRGPKGS